MIEEQVTDTISAVLLRKSGFKAKPSFYWCDNQDGAPFIMPSGMQEGIVVPAWTAQEIISCLPDVVVGIRDDHFFCYEPNGDKIFRCANLANCLAELWCHVNS